MKFLLGSVLLGVSTALNVQSRLATRYSGWPQDWSRKPPFEYSDCLFNFYHCSDSASPGWPSNKDQCAAELIACQEYLDVHSKPMHCTPCNCLEETTRKPVKQPSSCEELITSGVSVSGVYKLLIEDITAEVYCDMETNDGGWTVLHRRGGFGADDALFNKTWKDYKLGFGNLKQDVWVGLDVWHKMTASQPQEMLVTLKSKKGHVVKIVINDFYIGDEESKYRLNFTTATTTPEEGKMVDSLLQHRLAKFSTPRKGSDGGSSINCAELAGAGWWFVGCYDVILTLPASKGAGGIVWPGSSTTDEQDWVSSEMKIRPMKRPYLIQ